MQPFAEGIPVDAKIPTDKSTILSGFFVVEDDPLQAFLCLFGKI
jgi:hypothetical protein